MNQICPPSVISEQAKTDPFLPSLCTPRGQVDLIERNPDTDKELQKNANIHWLDENGFFSKATQLLNCGLNYVHLKCANGHEKYGKMHCDNDFCTTCGKKGSRAHKTRVIRAKDRLMWAPVLGYVVFTLPDKKARAALDLETLKRLEKEAYNIIQHHFNAPGAMIRTHLAGNHAGTLQIHINALFPMLNTNGIGVVQASIIDATRKSWTDFINGFFSLNCETTNIHYGFATTSKKKAHKIRYVLRPVVDAFMFMTLSDEDKRYIMSLGGWHNTRWFGKLSNALYKKYLLPKNVDPDAFKKQDPLLSNVCPCCGTRFRFVDIVHKDNLPIHKLRRLDKDTLVDFAIFSALQPK